MTNEKEPVDYNFTITGTMSVNPDHQEVLAFDRSIVGFTLPDGRTARLVAGIEIEAIDGRTLEYITDEQQMRELGIELADYDETKFEQKED